MGIGRHLERNARHVWYRNATTWLGDQHQSNKVCLRELTPFLKMCQQVKSWPWYETQEISRKDVISSIRITRDVWKLHLKLFVFPSLHALLMITWADVWNFQGFFSCCLKKSSHSRSDAGRYQAHLDQASGDGETLMWCNWISKDWQGQEEVKESRMTSTLISPWT